jgi:hypothetical protein
MDDGLLVDVLNGGRALGISVAMIARWHELQLRSENNRTIRAPRDAPIKASSHFGL